MKPPLSSLFIEVDVVDGDIATPYILGRGSLKKNKKSYPWSYSHPNVAN
jgi:hypothetical protein